MCLNIIICCSLGKERGERKIIIMFFDDNIRKGNVYQHRQDCIICEELLCFCYQQLQVKSIMDTRSFGFSISKEVVVEYVYLKIPWRRENVFVLKFLRIAAQDVKGIPLTWLDCNRNIYCFCNNIIT